MHSNVSIILHVAVKKTNRVVNDSSHVYIGQLAIFIAKSVQF